MFKIIDTEKSFLPVKSGFTTAAKAYDWAKKNLPQGQCCAWGKGTSQHRCKYFIRKY